MRCRARQHTFPCAVTQDIEALLSTSKGLLPLPLVAQLCLRAMEKLPAMPISLAVDLAEAALRYVKLHEAAPSFTRLPEAEALLQLIEGKVGVISCIYHLVF